MDPDTLVPSDDLTPDAVRLVSALGSSATKVSQILDNQDRAVFTAIQEGIDKANAEAIAKPQKVRGRGLFVGVAK